MIKSDLDRGEYMDDPYSLGLKDHLAPEKESLDPNYLEACFEWADSNPECEDRNGLFVTLNKENKLVIGGKGKIIGLTTRTQAFDPAMQWVNYSGIGEARWSDNTTNCIPGPFAKICRKTGLIVRKRTFPPSKKDIVRVHRPFEREGVVKVKVMW